MFAAKPELSSHKTVFIMYLSILRHFAAEIFADYEVLYPTTRGIM